MTVNVKIRFIAKIPVSVLHNEFTITHLMIIKQKYIATRWKIALGYFDHFLPPYFNNDNNTFQLNRFEE